MARPPEPDEQHSAIAHRRSAASSWNGIGVQTTEFWCTGEVLHMLPFGDSLRLSAVLEEVGGEAEPRLRRDEPCPIAHTPLHMHLAPAGVSLWGYSSTARYVRDVTLVFDALDLEARLGETFRTPSQSTPRLRFSDPVLATLLGLLADTVGDDDPSAVLYGDGLTTAISARLFAAATTPTPSSTKLAPWQLRRVVEYLDAHLSRPVALEELAQLTGLSQRHFARAFKSTTGQAPYRWHVERRVARSQVLLLQGEGLEEIAAATGFLDASHFGRVFRRLAGTTPGAWRRAHLR